MKNDPLLIVACCASFTGGASTYVLVRAGVPIAQGGEGVTWACSCPDWMHRGNARNPCKHLRGLWARARFCRAHDRAFTGSTFYRLTHAGAVQLGVECGDPLTWE